MSGIDALWQNAPWLTAALQLVLIVVLVLLARLGLRVISRQLEKRLEKTTPDPERLARLQTLVLVGRGAAWALALLAAGLMALHILGINITPLLAGVGVAGLALSLGAQTLIQDFIGGILVLAENHFTVGDFIQVGDVSGGVERITLRATYLRDVEGRLHIVPNGSIRTVSNLTADWARAIVNFNVALDADMGQALGALEAAAARAQADEGVQADLLEAPQALGWIDSTDWAVQVRLMAKTRPGRQWAVKMALRQYAVEALQAAGVKLALPAQEVRLEKL